MDQYILFVCLIYLLSFSGLFIGILWSVTFYFYLSLYKLLAEELETLRICMIFGDFVFSWCVFKFWVEIYQVRTKLSDVSLEPRAATGDHATEYLPILRSGAWADIGSRSSMEDVYVCTDNFMSHHRSTSSNEGTHAFYGVTTFSTLALHEWGMILIIILLHYL